MSSSWSKALAPLGGACACSLALHVAAGLLLEFLPGSPGGFAGFSAGRPLQARVQAEEAGPVAPLAQAGGPEARPARAPRRTPARQTYLSSRELDVRPSPVRPVEPAYPNDAYLRDIAGRVVVRLFISETGTVEKAVIVSSEPKGTFDEAVQRAFLAARFAPGMKAGRPVKTQMVLEVRYDPPAAGRN